MRCSKVFRAAASLAIVTVVGLLSSTAWAVDILDTRDSADFNYLYTGADFLSHADWGVTTTPNATVEGDYLRYNVGGSGMFTWMEQLLDVDGWTAEISLQVTQPGAEAYPSVITGIVSDGEAGQYNFINIGADAVYAGQRGELDTTLVLKDMTDGFHQVRIAQAPGSGLGDTHVWIDGQLTSKGLKGLVSYGIQRQWWGQNTGAQNEGQCLIEYMRVDTSGGFAPDGWVPPVVQEKDSITFDYRYEMDVLPSSQDLDGNTVADFEIGGPGSMTISASDDVLLYDSTTDGVFCRSTMPGGIWEGKTSTIDGYTIEISLKVNSNEGNSVACCIFSSPSGTDSDAYLTVGADGQGWGGAGNDGDNFALGENDNSDTFHVFRLMMHPGEDAYSVWRDGVLIGDKLARGYSYNEDIMYFGDGSGVWGGDVEIDYIRMMPGAFAPVTAVDIPGDANRDGYVDVSDLGILATNYGTGGGFGWEDGDFTGDGLVDVSDLGILATSYGTTPEAQSVPEPCVMILLSAAVLCLAAVRRKR